MEWIVTLLIGGIAIVFGGFFLQRQRVLIRRFREEPGLNERQTRFLVSQQQRRMLTSLLVIVVGVLIPFCYDAITRQQAPMLASLLLVAILLLILLIALLAVSDLLTSRYLQVDLQLKKAEIELKRQLLEKELENYRGEGSGQR